MVFKRLRLRLLRQFLRSWIPRSLFIRSLLIIVLPIALMQIFVSWTFFEAYWQTVNKQLSESLAGDIAWDIADFDSHPDIENLTRIVDRAERTQSLKFTFNPGAVLPSSPETPGKSLLPHFDQTLRNTLDDRMSEDFILKPGDTQNLITVLVQVQGGVISVTAPKNRAFATRGYVFVLWLVGVSFLLTAIAIAFIRNQVRAIERLAFAAEAFGKGLEVPHFKPHGAREVRQAAQAFIDMKSRIQRHLEQRTTLLAAVSHDLRTPLTRLRLEAELAPASPRIEAIKKDLSEMDHMITEFLTFARGEGEEMKASCNINDMLKTLGEEMRKLGLDVTCDLEPNLADLRLRPSAMKRALNNLIINAATYADQVFLSSHLSGQGKSMGKEAKTPGIIIHIDDNGPGISESLYEEAFKPFTRLDQARNQNPKRPGLDTLGSSSVGLGLAITRDIVRSHGGEVSLHKSPMGGLRVRVYLPL